MNLANHPYVDFLEEVEKPARYAGGEHGAVRKDWAAVEARVCLAFPDVYDIGMSHLGYKILYKILNDDPRTLAERVYCPWFDMEAALRKRGRPLISLESCRPLADFDVVGFSLQFELTYTNILTMLDLGGIPLRANERGEDDPLVVAGGPTATHPEPVAPFFDAIVIGDGEAKLTELSLCWTRLKGEGKTRIERLRALAALGAVYVPSLYEVEIEPANGIQVLSEPTAAELPFPVDRAVVNINDFPFPDDGPTGGPEAIFDRTSIEITRGCTEGCRFCQAGMIYRPVQERDPQQVYDTVMSAVRKSGNDEVSLTALSTADVSYINPLIKKIAPELAKKKISLGVSSLRAYGLEPELIGELTRVRAAGLTFAPEAGSQRMRDVVNKNVTEEQLHETAERVFSHGHRRMKLYFMIGLPTEREEDVRGIVQTGARTAQVGRQAAGRKVDVTVSVSTHVPKPFTPFQWTAMDPLADIERKQAALREEVRPHRQVTLRTHDAEGSVLEGILARGDRRLADVIERAWRGGARFDSWDEKLRLDQWREALAHYDVDQGIYLGTLPVHGRLPWDHIDVGLEEGFLLREYRRALKDQLSPPCGKVAGAFIHHTNLPDAQEDERKLVCYDCGVACDMTQMREERLVYLDRLGARKRPLSTRAETEAGNTNQAPRRRGPKIGDPNAGHRYRFRYEKTGPTSLLSHLDVLRELPRVFRRLDIEQVYTGGYRPKPAMSFGPALSVGVMSVDEYVDLRLVEQFDELALSQLLDQMNEAAPSGLAFSAARPLGPMDRAITRVIAGARYRLLFSPERCRQAAESAGSSDVDGWLRQRVEAVMAAESLPIQRIVKGRSKVVDVRHYLQQLTVFAEPTGEFFQRLGLEPDVLAVEALMAITPNGAAKTSELAAVLWGQNEVPRHRAVRVALFGEDPQGRFSPLDLERQAQAPKFDTISTAS